MAQVPCDYCKGTGQLGRPDWHYDCPDCRGTGFIEVQDPGREVKGPPGLPLVEKTTVRALRR